MLRLKRSIPDLLQGALNDVGAQFAEIFEKPMVKRSMSVLGKQSGDVRADKALRNKAAEGLLAKVPSAQFILDQLDMTPIEGLQLLNDPLIGPIIKNALAGGLKGFKGFGQGKKSGSSSGELGRV